MLRGPCETGRITFNSRAQLLTDDIDIDTPPDLSMSLSVPCSSTRMLSRSVPSNYTFSPSEATPHLTINHDVAADLDSSNAFEG